MTRSNMSTVTNKGVNMRCKAVTENLFTVAGFIVEPSKDIVKPNVSLEASIFSR